MELTINIKNSKDIATFFNLIKKMDNVEIVDVKEDDEPLLHEHKVILEERLKRIESGETTFTKWELIQDKYGNKAI